MSAKFSLRDFCLSAGTVTVKKFVAPAAALASMCAEVASIIARRAAESGAIIA